MAESPAILLTGVGKRYDIVACFAQLTTTIAVDPNPLAPAQYAAHVRAAPPPIADPGYVPFLRELCERHRVGAVIPLTDLDIEVLARAGAEGLLPTVLPAEEPDFYPVMVKPRRGSGARSIHLARDRAEKNFFVRYVAGGRPGYEGEPVMVQRAMGGPELSIDCLGDLEGRCLNAIPRTMLESRGGESIKGAAIRDSELIELGRHAMEALTVRGPATIQVFRDPEVGLGITDVNTRFGGAFPAPAYAALPGRTYPELIVRMAAGETIAPHVGEFREGRTFTRYYWQLELDERLQPTGREIVPGGPPAPGA